MIILDSQKIFVKFMQPFVISSVFAVMVAVGGCLYMPPIGNQFTEEKRAQIVVGKTTQEQVIELIGKPGILVDSHLFIYEVDRSKGTIWFVAANGYSGGIFPVGLENKYFRLLMSFNNQNILERYEVEAAKERLLEGVIPESIEKSVDPLTSELILKGEGKDWLGVKTGVGFNSLAISSDGQIIGAAGFKLVGGLFSSKKIWIKNLITGELRVINTSAYDKAFFSPDLTKVALLNRPKATILETKTGKALLVYEEHKVSCLAFDPTGQFVASGGYGGDIRIWDTQTGRERVIIKGHESYVLSLTWSHDGRLLTSTGRDGFVKMWWANSGKEAFKRLQEAKILSISYGGNMLAINQGSHVELWRMKYNSNYDRQAIRVEFDNAFLLPYFNTASSEISLSWSLDGRYLAAGNGCVVVYDVEKWDEIFRLIPSGNFLDSTDLNHAAHTLVFSPDGKSILMGTNEGIYRNPLLATQVK